MKILMINGSPNKNGSTKGMIEEIMNEFNRLNPDVILKVFEIGNKAIKGCSGCRKCMENQDNKCIENDIVNEILKEISDSDAIILGSPVYYAGINGSLKSVLDRLFYAGVYGGKNLFLGKVGAGIAVARRAGAVNSVDILNKYFQISGVITAPSKYWPIAFSQVKTDLKDDKEGLQTLRYLAKNINYLVSIIKLGKDNNIYPPLLGEDNERTNFIR